MIIPLPRRQLGKFLPSAQERLLQHYCFGCDQHCVVWHAV